MEIKNPIIFVILLIVACHLIGGIIVFRNARITQTDEGTPSRYNEKVLKKLIPRNGMIYVFLCVLTLPIYSNIPFILALILGIICSIITFKQLRWTFEMGERYQRNKNSKK